MDDKNMSKEDLEDAVLTAKVLRLVRTKDDLFTLIDGEIIDCLRLAGLIEIDESVHDIALLMNAVVVTDKGTEFYNKYSDI